MFFLQSTTSVSIGDLHKVHGPGTKLQQGQDKARGRKTPVRGVCNAQTERRGRVSKDSLGWREGAKAGMGQEQTKAARLGWREGAKAREAGPGNTGSEWKQGRRGPGTKRVCCPAKLARGQGRQASANTKGQARHRARPASVFWPEPWPSSPADGGQGPRGRLQCRTQQCART